jgi:hypothetical protein
MLSPQHRRTPVIQPLNLLAAPPAPALAPIAFEGHVYRNLPPALAAQLAALPPMPARPVRGRGRGRGRGRHLPPQPLPPPLPIFQGDDPFIVAPAPPPVPVIHGLLEAVSFSGLF